MHHNLLGSTEISISEVGLGTWALGGPNYKNGHAEGWSEVNRNEAIQGISYALDIGINHFDSADIYGNGRAEKLLADGLGESLKEVVISSKVGWLNNSEHHTYHPNHIRQQCERTLQNLRRDYLDIYYFHHGDFGKQDCYLDEAVATMQNLRDEGKIRAIGLSAYTQKDFKRLIPKIKPQVVQAWAHMMDYHFIADNSTLMKLCKDQTIGFIGYQPLEQGILLGKYTSNNPPTFGDGDHRGCSYKFKDAYLSKVEVGLNMLSKSYDTSVEERARLALQFVLHHKGVAGTIVGFRNKMQIETILNRFNSSFTKKDLSNIYKAFQ